MCHSDLHLRGILGEREKGAYLVWEWHTVPIPLTLICAREWVNHRNTVNNCGSYNIFGWM